MDDSELPVWQTVLTRILQHFGSQVATYITNKMDGVVICNSSIDVDTLPSLIKTMSDNHIVNKAAEIIINTLLAVRSSWQPLPNALTSKHFSDGQAPIPKIITKFVLDIISSHPLSPSNMEMRVAKGLASDLYNTTKGHVNPAKHLCLSVGMKSMTGSEKVCDILHKLGHAISTSQENRIITEIGEEITRKQYTIPDGLYQEPNNNLMG